ncbi:MAG: hypothetical protein MJY93_08050 [Fibrobacter sp.]|nr:hypothetical protein [archaeon]MCQ2090186.1 hypothetical protein [Fibrobacter sp.]
MKKIICILLSLFIWNCGGGSGFSISYEQDTKGNSETQNKNYDYSEFREVNDKPKDEHGFFDGYFAKHKESIKQTSFDYDAEGSDENGNISVKHVATTAYVNYNGVPSQVLVLRNTYNAVGVHLSWDSKESYENREDLKFFLCNPDGNYDPIDKDYYTIDPSEWSKGSKTQIMYVNRENVNENKTVGLCMQYKAYLPVLLDVLEARVYDSQPFSVTYVEIGKTDEETRTKIEKRIQETLNRAAVKVDLSSSEMYQIPRDFHIREFQKRSFDDNSSLYVQVGEKNGLQSRCYDKIRGDLYWIKDLVETKVAERKFERRTSVIFNLPTVKYWTIGANYRPCTDNLEDQPSTSVGEYMVGMLNIETYDDCQRTYPEADNVYYSYFNNKWVWKNVYGEIIDDQIETYISPDCHVILDTDRCGMAHWEHFSGQKSEAAQRYYRSLMDDKDLGVTKITRAIGTSGLVSYNPPKNETVYVHELTHLLGLSDLENETGNLMYKDYNGMGLELNNYELRVKNTYGIERQWDCLHDERNADGCSDFKWRTLTY